MKTRIFASMLVIALAAALVGGATMAWFTDTATNANNVFTAGTLNIQINGQENVTTPLTVTNIAPGWQLAMPTMHVNNAGSLDAKIRGLMTPRSTDVPANLALLAGLEYRFVTAMYPTVPTASDAQWHPFPQAGNTLTQIFEFAPLPASGRLNVAMEFRLRQLVGNAAQGGTITFDFVVEATQIGNPGWAQ